MKKYLQLILAMIIPWVASATWQQPEVSGNVSDESGEGLPGVTILVEGTGVGTVTDINGDFTLQLPAGATNLVFSSVGFLRQVVPISDKSTFTIQLRLDIEELEEVVVTGYGQTQNKRLVSTSISSIGLKEIQDRPIANVEQAIQGTVPAVVVIQESGSPGATQTIRMRGISTAGNATPLVLVNGVQVPDINFINQNDVAGLSVFKDAASSAIYGARGGNGVIQIESKNGADAKKPLNVRYNSYFGIQSLLSEGEYLNTQEYARYYNESSLYQIREGEDPNGRQRFTDEEIALLPNTTWIREISDDATISDNHLALFGKKGETDYYASFGNFHQNGIIGITSFNRKSATASINSQLTEKLKISALGTYSWNTREFIAENNFNSRLISSVAALPPIYPARDENGNPFNNGDQTGVVVNGVVLNPQPEFGNPLLGLENTENNAFDHVFYGNAKLEYQLFDNLSITTAVGFLDRNVDIKSFNRSFAYENSTFQNPVNSLTETDIQAEFKQFEAYLNYGILRGDFDISFVAGTSWLENSSSSTTMTGVDFTVNDIDDVEFSDIIDETDITVLPGFSQLNRTQSFYGRGNLTLKDKYLFTATLRADASSRFGPNNRWGFFPSVSAGWLISSEDFLGESVFVDLLKLRASWGVNGNDQIAPYQYARRFVITPSGPVRQDSNPDVKWEEISQFNVGLDADLANNKIGVTVDYYIKETRDMLLDFDIPGFLGLPAPTRNAGTVRNKGLEAVLLYRDRLGSDFNYEVAFNIGTISNEVVALNGAAPISSANLRSFAGSPNVSRTDVGHPIASFYGLVFDGVDDKGDATYKDLNGDGVITEEGDRTFIGNPFPDFIYGINLRAGFKNFDFSTFFYGSEGNDVVNSAILYSVIYGNRTRRFVENAWTHENRDANVIRPSATEVVNNEFSSYYIEDGSYLRLKNVTLGYTFSNLKFLERGRIYLSANNIFTRTDYSGLDPEIGANNDPLNVGIDQGFYPQAKSYLLGLNISF